MAPRSRTGRNTEDLPTKASVPLPDSSDSDFEEESKKSRAPKRQTACKSTGPLPKRGNARRQTALKSIVAMPDESESEQSNVSEYSDDEPEEPKKSAPKKGAKKANNAPKKPQTATKTVTALPHAHATKKVVDLPESTDSDE